MTGFPKSKLTLRQRLSCAPGFLLLAVLLSAAPMGAPAENSGIMDRAVSEYEVKAAYIYYFAKFIDWPPMAFSSKGAPITIGVIGNDEFASLLGNAVKNKIIQERAIQVRLLKWPADLRTCHLVFIGSSEQRQFRHIAESLQDRPVLTITEFEESSPAKGILNLFVEGGKVQFEVNIASAEKAQLKISSKLLRLARGTVGSYSWKGE